MELNLSHKVFYFKSGKTEGPLTFIKTELLLTFIKTEVRPLTFIKLLVRVFAGVNSHSVHSVIDLITVRTVIITN